MKKSECEFVWYFTQLKIDIYSNSQMHVSANVCKVKITTMIILIKIFQVFYKTIERNQIHYSGNYATNH